MEYMKKNPEILAILVVYFVQGALGLSRLAISFYMKDKLQLTPADMANIGGITTLPWVIKPLYGFLSDGFPLFGYRRRSYLLAAGIIGSLSWLAMGADMARDSASLVLLTVFGSASVAVSDVVIDSVVVERSRDGQADGGIYRAYVGVVLHLVVSYRPTLVAPSSAHKSPGFHHNCCFSVDICLCAGHQGKPRG